MFPERIDVFESALVLPDQLSAGARTGAESSGERRLMLAVLEDAVGTLQNCRLSRQPHRRAEYDDARSWMEATVEDWPFSFVSICDALGFDPDVLRDQLLRDDHQRIRTTPRTKPRIIPLEQLLGDARAEVATASESLDPSQEATVRNQAA